MTVYVDAAEWTRAGVKNPRKKYAHMIADTLDELHAFAAMIEVKPHFFHRASVHHYDINEQQHLRALANGAKLVNRRELLTYGRAMK